MFPLFELRVNYCVDRQSRLLWQRRALTKLFGNKLVYFPGYQRMLAVYTGYDEKYSRKDIVVRYYQ